MGKSNIPLLKYNTMKKCINKFGLVFLGILFLFTGCKKTETFKSEDATYADFSGTWRGVITTFKDNERRQQNGTLMIYSTDKGQTLSAILSMDNINMGMQTLFNNGIYYFKLTANDTIDPYCLNWNLAGFAKLSAHNEMELNLAGNECGEPGDEFVKWEGNMIRVSEGIDESACYSFAKAGNKWEYRNYLSSGDTVTSILEITTEVSQGVFQGNTSVQTGNQVQNNTFTWSVSPGRFNVDSDGSGQTFNGLFRLDAPLAKPYTCINGNDTLSMTLMAINQEVDLSCGIFRAVKFRQEVISANPAAEKRITVIWLVNRIGIIRTQVLAEDGTTVLEVKELVNKNF